MEFTRLPVDLTDSTCVGAGPVALGALGLRLWDRGRVEVEAMLPIVSIFGFLASYISLVGGGGFDSWSFTEYSVLVTANARVDKV